MNIYEILLIVLSLPFVCGILYTFILISLSLFFSAGKPSKSQKIILFFSFTITFLAFFYKLYTSEYIGEFSFQPIYNANTGAPLSVITSIVLYIMFAFVMGLVPASAISLFSLILCLFLHRNKDESFLSGPNNKVDDDCSFSFAMSFSLAYSAIFILLLLHMSGIFAINI